MIMPCMNSASALEGALGTAPALAAEDDRDLLLAPGAPGWTIAGGVVGAGADCCAGAAAQQSASDAAASVERSVQDIILGMLPVLQAPCERAVQR
jgi:hypothetical protein